MPRTAQMHRVVRIDTAHSLVRTVFHDVASWPLWMPDLTACQVYDSEPGFENEPGRLRARVSQTALGRTWTQDVDVELGDEYLRARALGGMIRWRLVWGFRPPPDGIGTTLWMELEMKAGGFGLASGRMFQKMNERRFGKTIDAIRLRAGQLETREAVSAADRSLLTIYETADGFEVCYGGRRYVTRK